jgi:malate synthase
MTTTEAAPPIAGHAEYSTRHGRGRIVGEMCEGYESVLTPESIEFVAALCRRFEPRRQELLALRQRRHAELLDGKLPDFLPQTRHVRQSVWTVAPIVPDLADRRVEITGPVDRKMVINALNSGARVFMADFEDSNSPTWDNCVRGQINLRDAVRRTIEFSSPEGRKYRLNEKTATLVVRPRGWHLDEKYFHVSGNPASAALFDFGLFFFHNARELIKRGGGPYFYLPKVESHLEARLWNDVFVFAQRELGIPVGTIRATVLIETILAAFEMDEILFELRDHSAGLNCGRWDYIFSLIKKLGHDPRFILSDRSLVTMTTPFMRSYSLLAIQTCHRRGIHAIGGMAAQIPIKDDPAANEAALAKVRADKQREFTDGHDGTWVAHPGLVPVAMEQFAPMTGPHQIDRKCPDVRVTASDLLNVPEAPQITEQGIRTNCAVGIVYLESWLRGLGCVPINNLMEDAATAEISRAQLWQWVKHGVCTSDGQAVTAERVVRLLDDELAGVRAAIGEQRYLAGRFGEAWRLFVQMTRSEQCPEFLTSIAYKNL